MGTHKIRKEDQLVINHFKNGKSLSEMTEIIQRNYSTVQYIDERYKRKTGLLEKRERAPKHLGRMKKNGFWDIKNNPTLSATELATDIENHLQKNNLILRKIKES
jgi:transposase